MKYIKYLETKLGKIGIVEENCKISKIIIENNKIKDFNRNDSTYVKKDTKLLLEAEKQLKEYFEGKRKEFSLPLEKNGTDFQKKVWNALKKIPYGETRTYKDIAKVIGNEKASRAVGMANNKNNIPIIIPCHRVIGSNGSLIGYALGLEAKKYLLDLERKNKL